MPVSPDSRTYYEVLHVSRDAPVEIIRGSYRTLMQRLKCHPDLGGDTATAALINEAYAVLSDTERRAAYDARLALMERITDAPSNTYLQDGLTGTGAPNVVTAVLLDFRAYDTLGEATVLFCAVLGAVSLLRRKARVAAAPDESEANPK